MKNTTLSPKEYARLRDLTSRFQADRYDEHVQGLTPLEESERRALEHRLDIYGRE